MRQNKMKPEGPMHCPRRRVEEMRAIIERAELEIAGFRARQFDGVLSAEEKSAWKSMQETLFQRRRDLAEAVRLSSLCKSERDVATCETAKCYSMKDEVELPAESANDSAELEVPAWVKRG